MNLKSIVQSMREASHHPLAWLAFFVFIIVVTAVGITWNIAKEIRIENLQDEIKGLERDLGREREASAKKLDPKEVKNFLTFAAERIEDNINETNSSDIQIKARVTEDSEHILTTFSLEPVVPTERYDFLLEEKAYFPSGEYSLKMAYERSKFIKAIFSFIGIVQKYYPEEKADVKALFQGGADSKSNDIGIVSEYKRLVPVDNRLIFKLF
ncbi:MAG: hypothetical protein LGR52_06600 [Candidatus Thiosymbion ectosymbiont of Robbea hypermnestra]|nr:hypothetical protein [Candidatus Thiosymbion ectosymbiont of Robbea hypermnestra]